MKYAGVVVSAAASRLTATCVLVDDDPLVDPMVVPLTVGTGTVEEQLRDFGNAARTGLRERDVAGVVVVDVFQQSSASAGAKLRMRGEGVLTATMRAEHPHTQLLAMSQIASRLGSPAADLRDGAPASLRKKAEQDAYIAALAARQSASGTTVE